MPHQSNDHGKIKPGGYVRLCRVHGEHGPLYPCPEYDAETLNEIRQRGEEFRRNLNDPLWCEEQIARGLPPEGIAIFKMFAEGGDE